MSRSITRILMGGFLLMGGFQLLKTGLMISRVPLWLQVPLQQQVNTSNAAPSTSVPTTDTPTTTNNTNRPLQQQQQKRWQPFQVEINDYIESSERRHHAGTIAAASIDPWEYPALSAESLARSLRNRTIYIDGDSLPYYFAVLLLHFLDYLCKNGVDGKNPSPPVTDVKTILENEALYSGVKEHYHHLWGSGRKQFNRCFLRVGGGENDAKDDDEEKARTEDEALSSYVTVKHSFYYNQADSAEKLMLSTASANNSETQTDHCSSNNKNGGNHSRSKSTTTSNRPSEDTMLVPSPPHRSIHGNTPLCLRNRWLVPFGTEQFISTGILSLTTSPFCCCTFSITSARTA